MTGAATVTQQSTGTYAKARDLVALTRTLTTWLEPRLGAPVVVSGLSHPNGAGISNETIFFDALWTDHGVPQSASYVLRIHPDQFQIFLEPDFDLQVQILRTLGEDGHVAVPTVRWFEEDPTFLGTPFFVMDRMVGQVPVSNPNYNATGWLHDAEPAQRRHLWVAAMEQLCRIAEVPAQRVAFLDKPKRGSTGLQQQFSYWERSLGWSCEGEPPVALTDGLERLRSTFPANDDSTLSWGDARIGNMMFDEDFNVLGVMDWEGVSLGGAVQDLAWWLMIDDIYSTGSGYARLEGLGSREETIDFWENRLGRRADYLAWHEAFVAFKTSLLSARIQVASKRVGLDVPMNGRSPLHPRLAELLGADLSDRTAR